MLSHVVVTRNTQPGDRGSLVAIQRRGGGEDPWLCVTDFRQFCLYQMSLHFMRRLENRVNYGMYVAMAATG